MALRLKAAKSAPLSQLAANLRTTILASGSDLISAGTTKNLLASMESIGQMEAANLQNEFEAVRDNLRSQIQGIKGLSRSFGLESEGSAEEREEAQARFETALDAGAMAAMAAGNPEAYAQAAYLGQAQAAPGVTIVDTMASDSAAAMDYRPAVAMEAFNDKELRDHLPFSILFNIFASRQDDFSEMFFPTTVVAPDQAGLDVTVARMQVFNEVRHAASGAKVDFGKRNLIDAAVDYTILADEHTRLIPVVQPDGSSDDKFVADTIVAPFMEKVGKYEVPTSALALDKDIDLIGISQYQPLLGAGVIDHSDDVDARVSLDKLYLQAGSGVAVAFNVNRLARSQFNKTVEGNSRLLGLQFTSTDLVIDKDSKAIDGSAVTAFAGIVSGKYTVRLSVNVSGELNVEFGNVKVWAASVSVASIQDENGNSVPTSGGAGAAVVTALAGLKIVGYTLRANRTNANRRTRGHLLDTVYETQRYTIPLGSPLSITSPVTGDGSRDAADQKALIAAARMRNSNNAVTALFAIADQLREATRGPKLPAGEVSGVGGLGRFLVDPFFEEHDLDLVESINSIKSQDRAYDISAVLVSAIRDIAYRMYQSTKIQPAIDALTGVAGEAPVLLVGTDQVLIRHLLVNGDSRTFGTVFDKAIVKASVDRRVYNKIFISLSRAGAEGPDPLTFGTHGWMSELIATMPISRNGQTSKEATVQPRTLHINNMPVLAIINVKGLSKVLVDKTATPALTSAGVANVYLDGLKYPTP
ncbi:hypothetical protein LUCX_285 [Xanthomonas phage vB_XciM_LucasX]|nr:hypothetical protein LUCX_285 [Xanthomonas phage vB_XciM_LucasX]